MMVWRRVFRPILWLLTVGVVALLALSPVWTAGGGSTDADTFDVARITRYRADFSLAADGDLTVTEQLRVAFPISRHGIFRFFDIVDASAPHARRIPEDLRITRDGEREAWQESTRDDGRFRVVRIGDPSVEIEGEHSYTISYRIAGVIERGTTGQKSQFYWNLVPGGWTMPIDASELYVNLPTESGSVVQCAVGFRNAGGCDAEGAGTRQLSVETAELPPRTPVTIKVGMNIATPPAGHERWWTQPWDGVLGPWSKTAAPIALGVVGLLAVLAGLVGLRKRRQAIEPEPGLPVMYAPPTGIGPAQAHYIISESVSRTQFVATLLYLAQQNVITLHRDDRGLWSIGDGTGPAGRVDAVSRAAISPLPLKDGKPLKLGADRVSVGKKVQSAETEFLAAPRRWALKSGNAEQVKGIGRTGIFAVLSLLLAFVIAAVGFGMSVLAVIPLAYALPALGVIHTGATTRRTESGRRLWSEAGGFKRMLSTPSSEQRFDFSARKDLYTAYIPWAVAFGVADKWAEKYRFETGEEPPVPGYIGGISSDDASWTSAGGSGSVAAAVEASFAAAVGSAIGAYVASITPASSSSSGSSWSSSDSGGGFSGGGGGGGGGGGSW
jgi:uncharacterized membrane protein YgcG